MVTLNITIFSITTLSITTFSKMKFSIIVLSILTFNIVCDGSNKRYSLILIDSFTTEARHTAS